MAPDYIAWIGGTCTRLRGVLVDHPAVLKADPLVYTDAVVGEELVGAATSICGKERGGEEGEEGEEGERGGLHFCDVGFVGGFESEGMEE